MPSRLAVPAQHIVGDAGHTTDHDTVYSILGELYQPFQFYVGDLAYGALGNVKVVNDANITSGLNVLTSATAAFTAADVGKYIVVNFAGASATTPLSTTISGYTNATTVTLTANAGTTVTNGAACYGTDDTAAIQSAINAAVAYAQAGAGERYAEVVFTAATYVLGAAVTKVASPVYSCSQLNFSGVIGTGPQKVTIALRGVNAAPFAYWAQTVPQAPAGTVLFSTLMGQSFDATYGMPSVVGGPNPTQGYGSGALVFNNMMVVVRDISIVCPLNPSLTAWDFRGMAEMNCTYIAASAWGTPAQLAGSAANTNGMGLYAPSSGNNDNVNVQTYGCEGFYYGVGLSEHFTAQRLGLVYCNTGMWIACTGGASHGASILYASVEQCPTVIATGASGGKFPLFIGKLETEQFTTLVNDPTTSSLYGIIRWGGLAGDVIAVTNATNIEIISDNQPRGHVAAPGVPATTVAYVNAFWRHAAVTILPGASTCAVTVDGTATGLTLASGGIAGTVFVPSGKSITLTYTAAPTWNWVLM